MAYVKIFRDLGDPALVSLLVSGGIAVMRTDTVYGIVARADSRQAVERIYELKGRDENKPFIILIADTSMLYDLPPDQASEQLRSWWPGKNSVILPSPSAPDWLRRGGSTLAYRLPAHEGLRQLIAMTGPLVAPSANPQAEPTATNIDEAQRYFGERIDAYVDGGVVAAQTSPSRLFRALSDGTWERLR